MRKNTGHLAALSIIVGVCACAMTSEDRPNDELDRVVGGHSIAIEDVPWHVSVRWTDEDGNDSGHFCGGSIIHPQWIITAAHCMEEDNRGIKAGITMQDEDGQSFGRFDIDVYVHEGYSPETIHNDIALVRLHSPLELGGRVQVIEPATECDFMPGDWARVIGWGATQVDGYGSSMQLLAADLSIVGDDVMDDVYGFPAGMTLGAEAAGKSACAGDSGGSLGVFPDDRWRLAGVSSFGGPECATPGFPGGYTRVPSYIEWINGITGLGFQTCDRYVDLGQESCCTEHQSPGCWDQGAHDCVGSKDPYCIEVEGAWDYACMEQAFRCGYCGGPDAGSGDCCNPNGSWGCDDWYLQACACDLDGFCCDTEWDETCAGYAVNDCGAHWCS